VHESHAGMMYDHGEDDEDSDELSPAEKALIAAASGAASVPVEATPESMHSSSDKAAKVAAPSVDDQDDLSPEEKRLINAASTHAAAAVPELVSTAAHKAPRTHATHEHRNHEDENSDALSAADQALIKAATAHKSTRATAKLTTPAPKAKAVKAKKSKPVSSKRESKLFGASVKDLASEAEKLKKDSDDLTPEEKKLIVDAGHKKFSKKKEANGLTVVGSHTEQQIATSPAVIKRSQPKESDAMMKKAMEKITKAAARKAVAQITGVPPSHLTETSAPKTAHAARGAVPQATASTPMLDPRKVVMGKGAVEDAAPAKDVATVPESSDTDTSAPASNEDADAGAKADEPNAPEAMSWEDRLAAADRRAEQMARSRKGALSVEEHLAAEQMRNQLEAEERSGLIQSDAAINAPMLLPAPMLDAVMRGQDVAPMMPTQAAMVMP